MLRRAEVLDTQGAIADIGGQEDWDCSVYLDSDQQKGTRNRAAVSTSAYFLGT